MAKKPDKKEEPKPETVPGYSGSPHEGKKPAAHKGEGASSPLGHTKPTQISTGRGNE